MPVCVGVVFALLTFAFRAEERGVTLRPTLLRGVAPVSGPGIRGESIFFCADIVEDGDDLLSGAARRGAGEERSDVVVVGSLGIRGRGGGDARALRFVDAMFANRMLHYLSTSPFLHALFMVSCPRHVWKVSIVVASAPRQLRC